MAIKIEIHPKEIEKYYRFDFIPIATSLICYAFIFIIFLTSNIQCNQFSLEENCVSLFLVFILGTGIYYYAYCLSKNIKTNALKQHAVCYVNSENICVEFREFMWKKKITIPLDEVQLIYGFLNDDVYLKTIPFKKKEILLFDFTKVDWEKYISLNDLLVSNPVGGVQQKTLFFHSIPQLLICCINSDHFQIWQDFFIGKNHSCYLELMKINT